MICAFFVFISQNSYRFKKLTKHFQFNTVLHLYILHNLFYRTIVSNNSSLAWIPFLSSVFNIIEKKCIKMINLALLSSIPVFRKLFWGESVLSVSALNRNRIEMPLFIFSVSECHHKSNAIILIHEYQITR